MHGERRLLRTDVLTLLAAPLLFGCTSDSPGESRTVFGDSAGVSIATNELPVREGMPRCELGDQVVRLGSVDGPRDGFYRISDATLVPEADEILVLHRSAAEVLVFGTNGELRTTFGRAGDGPGEFGDPVELMVLEGDSIGVWDWELNRISIWSRMGEHQRTVSMLPPVVNPTGHTARAAGGSLIGAHVVHPYFDPGEFVLQELEVLLYSDEGTLTSTVVTLPYGRRALVDPDTRMMGAPTFEPRGVFAGRGPFVYSSSGDQPEVQVTRINGQLERVIRWRSPARLVQPRDIAAHREQRLAGLEGGFRRLVEQQLDRVPVHDVFPAISALHVTTDGDLWVSEYPGPSDPVVTWLKFTDMGAFECLLEVPRNWSVTRLESEVLLTVARDEREIEFVELWSVVSPR